MPKHLLLAELFVVFRASLRYNGPLLKPFKFLLWTVLVACGLVASASTRNISSNTVARFHISTGEREVGNVDVELFDLSAPATFTPLDNLVPLTLAIDRGSGRSNSGSSFHAASQADVPLQDLMVQGLALGGGTFYGPDQTGTFLFRRNDAGHRKRS
jgi:hypothetical protein